MAQQNYDLSNIVIENSQSNTIFSKFSAQQALLYVRNAISNENLIGFYDKLLNNNDIDYFINMNATISDVHNKKSKIIIANSMWIMKNTDINDEYQTKMSKIGEIYVNKDRANMQNMVDEWIQTKTHKKIMHTDLSPDAELIILNVVYFKNIWKNPFNMNDSHTDTFKINKKQKTKKEFMCMNDRCRFFESINYRVLCKDYQDDFFLVVIMNVNGYDAPLLSDDELSYCINNCVECEVKINIPRFKIEVAHDLKSMINSYSKQNMNHVVDNISKSGLIVSKIVQQIIIRVDEKGTEAAALTKIEKTKSKSKPVITKPKIFNADKPFSFHIVKKVNNKNVNNENVNNENVNNENVNNENVNNENVVLFSGVLKE